MSTNGNRKGKVGERELAAELQRLFGVACRRGVQYQGGPDSPDVVGIPGVHVECKRTESLRLWDALRQAIRDADDQIPVVCHRASRREWVAIVRLDDLPRLATQLYLVMAAK